MCLPYLRQRELGSFAMDIDLVERVKQDTASAALAAVMAEAAASPPRRLAGQVRRPVAADARRLAALFSEMQRHYGEPVSDGMAAAAAAFACRPAPAASSFEPRTLIAVDADGQILGSIVLNVTFPARMLARSLYVRDLYVAAAARRRGVARALLRAAARLTLEEGFCALDWTTDAANAGARMMYEGAGARQVGRVFYRLAGEDLSRAAA
jgi:hypothetical protein